MAACSATLLFLHPPAPNTQPDRPAHESRITTITYYYTMHASRTLASLFVATLVLTSAVASAQSHTHGSSTRPVHPQPPKLFSGFRDAWKDDKPIGAGMFVAGKVLNIPGQIFSAITKKPVKRRVPSIYAKDAEARRKREQEGDEDETDGKSKGKLAQLKDRVVQFFKDRGCNAKDGWYLARHPEVDLSWCDLGKGKARPAAPRRPVPRRPCDGSVCRRSVPSQGYHHHEHAYSEDEDDEEEESDDEGDDDYDGY